MKILLIVAMKSELQGFLSKIKFEVNFYKGFDYHYAKIDDKEIYLLKSEVGKVNAAILTSTFIQKVKPKYVINAGIGGSLHENIKPYSTIFSTKVAYFDVDLTPFGLPLGQLDNMDLYFKSSKILHKTVDLNDYKGLIVSSDTFVCKNEQKEHILNHFPKALCCDMEGASIAHVSTLFKRKFIIIRTISDVVGEINESDAYEDRKPKAIQIVVDKTINLIENL